MSLFFRRLILFSFVLLISFVVASYFLIKNNDDTYQFLYKYQLNKIERPGRIATLFIGDSSLGNSIDSGEFSILSSQPTMNIALTGLYGYGGSYNILKTAYRNHPEIKNVIVMQTLDIQTRPVSYAGYVRTAGSMNDFMELSIVEKIGFIKDFFRYVQSIKLDNSVNKEILFQNDYVRQGDKKDFDVIMEGFSPYNIRSENNKFLSKIASYCRKNDLNLVYINGPISEKRAFYSQSYIEAIDKVIPETGIRLIPDIIRAENSELGDSEDHIRPDLKKEYTAKYYEIIKKYLKDNK